MDEAVALPGNVGCRTNSVFILLYEYPQFANMPFIPLRHYVPPPPILGFVPPPRFAVLPLHRRGVRNALLAEVAAKASQTE